MDWKRLLAYVSGSVDEELLLRNEYLATENRRWGYDRIVGALANLGHTVSDQTVGNILKRHGIPPAPERRKQTTWREFVRSHMNVLAATDFFTAEVWTKGGIVTYYVLFFVHLATRKVHIAGITPHPHATWMTQMARNVTLADEGFLAPGHRLIHDRDSKYSAQFLETIRAAGVETLKLPAHSPNLNAIAERWVRSVKDECLSRLILFGEAALRRVLAQYVAHYHEERNHQGKDNVILFPDRDLGRTDGDVCRRQRLGGLLNYYCREAG